MSTTTAPAGGDTSGRSRGAAGDVRGSSGGDEPSWLERPMPTDRWRAAWAAVVTGVVAAGVRFWSLGSVTDHGTPIFDEKFYAVQAWQVLRNGGFEDNPGYELVVHPPLGKQLIATGVWLLGYGPVGWRAAGAAAGVLCVVLIVRAARRLTRSTALGVLAGLLLIGDGVSHVAARTALLDVFQQLFVLAAFTAILVDRDQVRTRLAVSWCEGRVGDSAHGPRLGARWWRLAAGTCLGAACAVKWSGLYYLVVFAALVVVLDAVARRHAGVPRPWRAVAVRDLAPALWAFAVVPPLVYLASWLPWIASETGTDRRAVGQQLAVGGPWGWLPDWLRGLAYFHAQVLSFHTGLDTTRGDPHPWESKPWTWPMGLRPMLYAYDTGADLGCGATDCVRAVMLIGTPALWWVSLPALGWAAWRGVTRRDWRFGVVVVAYAAGVVPWFLNLDRQMYFFYMTPTAPFLVLAVTLALGVILGPARAGRERRQTGTVVVALYTGIVVANFAWLYPVLTGIAVTVARWDAELWLPSWR